MGDNGRIYLVGFRCFPQEKERLKKLLNSIRDEVMQEIKARNLKMTRQTIPFCMLLLAMTYYFTKIYSRQVGGFDVKYSDFKGFIIQYNMGLINEDENENK